VSRPNSSVKQDASTIIIRSLENKAQLPVATKEEVYLYVQSLPLAEELLSTLYSLLNKEEQQRAARYHFERDQKRFIAARGLLRYILSTYLNKAAADILFQYGPQGKPYVADTALQFNVSHSDDRIVIGIGNHHPLGVDVEHMTRIVEMADIATRFFTTNEAQQINALSGDAQRRAFFNVWTRKEALLKAIGSGLSLSLQACEVSVSEEELSTVLACNAPSFDKHDWQVHSRALTDDYLAAAVVHRDLKVVWI
jgi:4'-phosphopantetheinyl transferase